MTFHDSVPPWNVRLTLFLTERLWCCWGKHCVGRPPGEGGHIVQHFAAWRLQKEISRRPPLCNRWAPHRQFRTLMKLEESHGGQGQSNECNGGSPPWPRPSRMTLLLHGKVRRPLRIFAAKRGKAFTKILIAVL